MPVGSVFILLQNHWVGRDRGNVIWLCVCLDSAWGPRWGMKWGEDQAEKLEEGYPTVLSATWFLFKPHCMLCCQLRNPCVKGWWQSQSHASPQSSHSVSRRWCLNWILKLRGNQMSVWPRGWVWVWDSDCLVVCPTSPLACTSPLWASVALLG